MNENDLNLVENSISHPTRRPRDPIAITRMILEDLQIFIRVKKLIILPQAHQTLSISSSYLVASVAAMRAVRIETAV